MTEPPLPFMIYPGPLENRRWQTQGGNGFLNMRGSGRNTHQQGGNIFLNMLPAIGKWLLPIVAGGLGSFVTGLANRFAGGETLKSSAKEALKESAIGTLTDAAKKFKDFPEPKSSEQPVAPMSRYIDGDYLKGTKPDPITGRGAGGRKRKLDDNDGSIALYKADAKRIKRGKRISNF